MSRVEDKAARRAHPAPMPKAEAWIREHGAAYAGRWVALRDDELVASAISFTELRRQLSSLDDVLVTVIE
jgi:hypothetical protein